MKQRLVGAITIGCLAIIFVPIILDGEGLAPSELSDTAPQAPPMPEPMESEPVRPTVLSDTENINVEAPGADAVQEDTPDAGSGDGGDSAAQRPNLDERGLPESWSVRLASFAESANADRLVNRLLDRGYEAYSRSVESGQGELTVVYVGPVLTRQDAQELDAELAGEFDLDGMVVEFAITELSQ